MYRALNHKLDFEIYLSLHNFQEKLFIDLIGGIVVILKESIYELQSARFLVGFKLSNYRFLR
jgi:hypothetical protein